MKKFLAIILSLTLTMSMVACGGSKPSSSASASTSTAPAASSSAPAPAASSSKPAAPAASKPAPAPMPKPSADLKNPEYTPEQVAVAEKFADMTDRFQALADKINADENLLAITELVDTMNGMIDAVNEDDALFADPANLTAEVLKNLEEDIKIGYTFLDEIDAMIANYSGKETVTISVEIVNETDGDLYTLSMSPANDDNWGGNLLTSPLAVGESGVTEMTFTKDTLVWDLLAGDSQDTTLTFMGIDFSAAPLEGAKLVLNVTEGGAYMASFVE